MHSALPLQMASCMILRHKRHCVHAQTLLREMCLRHMPSSLKPKIVRLCKFNHQISHWLAGLDVIEICVFPGHWVGVMHFDPCLQLTA